MTDAQRATLFGYLRSCHAQMVDACRQVGLIGMEEGVPAPSDTELQGWIEGLQGPLQITDARPR